MIVFNESKDNSIDKATTVCAFTAFQGPFQSQPNSITSHINSSPTTLPDVTDVQRI